MLSGTRDNLLNAFDKDPTLDMLFVLHPLDLVDIAELKYAFQNHILKNSQGQLG